MPRDIITIRRRAGYFATNAPPAFHANAVTFDGSTGFLELGGNLTGAPSDSRIGLLSFWFQLNGGNGVRQDAFCSTGGSAGVEIFVIRHTDNLWYLQIDSGTKLQLVTTSTFLAGGWHHILFSWDTPGVRGQLYVDGVSAGTPTIGSGTIHYNDSTDWFVGSTNSTPSELYNGNLAEVYFNFSETFDLSIAGNVAKFISGGKPVSLGSDGSAPTGNPPVVYLKNPAASYGTNSGTGGNYTIHGTITNAPTSPSD